MGSFFARRLSRPLEKKIRLQCATLQAEGQLYKLSLPEPRAIRAGMKGTGLEAEADLEIDVARSQCARGLPEIGALDVV
jgi:hypothetical protein